MMTAPKHGEGLYTSDDGYAMGKRDTNGLEQGKWLFYAPDSTLTECIHYRDGIEHGRSITYEVDGKIAVRSHFVNGRRHGVQRTYAPNGALASRIKFKHGHRVAAKIYNREFLMD
jgi:antitoxin component YwqK of YwqJK toxin-antitoxin module